ncbi:hypothetical protein PG985_016174 [Apiospora marii]|uniref:uncharacterized protein n=1 Tax=Apiospora marii TaxID=335849 RepID=UPI00312E3469
MLELALPLRWFWPVINNTFTDSFILVVSRLSGNEHVEEFEAISYIWGSDPPSVSVTINGRSFLVSRSLYRNLIRLRSPEKPRTVWIDAICIDQGDLDERARQVRRMSEIFSFAQQVVVLLDGRLPWGLGRAFESADRKPDASHIHYGGVRVATELLSNPWWTRTWVIQEVVLARRAVVHCGAHELAWDEFCRFIHQASSHPCFRAESRGVHLEDFRSINTHYYQRKRLAQLDQKSHINGQDLSRPVASTSRGVNLLALMFDFRAREATDPRDKILALQGLSEGPELCVPSYTRPAPELMIEFAKAHIRHSRSLSILALAECVRQHNSYHWGTILPSWCPAFTDREAVRQGSYLKPLWTGLPDDDSSGAYSAAGNLASPETFGPDTNTFGPVTFGPNTFGPNNFGLDVSHIMPRLSVQVLRHVCLTVSSIGPAYNASADSLKRELLHVMSGTPASMQSSLMVFLDKERVFDTWSKFATEPSIESAPDEGKRDGTAWSISWWHTQGNGLHEKEALQNSMRKLRLGTRDFTRRG